MCFMYHLKCTHCGLAVVSKSKVKPIFKEVYCVTVGGYISKKLTQSDVLVVLKYMHVGKIATESLKNWILRSDTDPKIFQFRVMMNHSKELGWWCSKSFNKSQQQKFFQTNSSHTMVSCHIQKSSCGLDKLCKAIATTSLCEIEVDEVRGRDEAYFSLHFGQKSKSWPIRWFVGMGWTMFKVQSFKAKKYGVWVRLMFEKMMFESVRWVI